MNSVSISGSGLYTPKHTISNEELVASFNKYVDTFNQTHQAAIAAGEITALAHSSAAFIEKASGITQRHVIDKAGVLNFARMCPDINWRDNDAHSVQCEMAVAAALEALEQAEKTPADVDLIIVACSNMERPYPAMAVELQAALGANGYAYDMNVACSSATFGIQAARDAVATGQANTVLVVSPEICSAQLNFCDRESHFIFGDACTALVIEKTATCTAPHSYQIISSKLATQYSNNIRNNAGFLNRTQTTPDTAPGTKNDKLFVQQGRKVFKEVVPLVAKNIGALLDEKSIQPSDIKRFWLHQANLSMNQLIIKKLLNEPVNPSIAPTILDSYANTSSAGSVIAFHLHHQDLQSGDLGVICSFGAGYSVGSLLLAKQ